MSFVIHVTEQMHVNMEFISLIDLLIFNKLKGIVIKFIICRFMIVQVDNP